MGPGGAPSCKDPGELREESRGLTCLFVYLAQEQTESLAMRLTFTFIYHKDSNRLFLILKKRKPTEFLLSLFQINFNLKNKIIKNVHYFNRA